MENEPGKVDLRDLAIDRSGVSEPALHARHRVLTRYVVPAVLMAGFGILLAWSAWDFVFPPLPVTVVSVHATTAEVRREGTALFNAAGWVEPRPTPVRVAALAPGVVERLLVVEDQPVEHGEPIAELVKADAQLAHRRALAELDLRKAELAEAHAQLEAARTRLHQPVHLEAALGEAEAALAKVATDLKNLPFQIRRAEADHVAMQKVYQSKLAAEAVVAGVEIDYAKGKADAAQALVEEMRGRVESLEAEQAALLDRRNALKTQLALLADEIKAKAEAEAKVEAANARLAQSRVAVDEAQLQLDRMTVVAPIDGRVFRLIAPPGTRLFMGPGHSGTHDASTVVTMYRPDMLQARVDVRFEDLPNVGLDQPVSINNPALEAPLIGRVLFISSEADIQKNTLEVKVEIPSPPPVFKPEMLVDVTFLAPAAPVRSSEESQELKIFVPEKLVQQTETDTFVWTADRSEGVARRTSVVLAPGNSGGLVQVVEGLTLTSRLIASRTDSLRDGLRIRIESEDTSIDTRTVQQARRSHEMHRLPTRNTP